MTTNRFLLDLFEAAVNPTVDFTMSLWYAAAEQPLRLEACYSANGIAPMLGGPVGRGSRGGYLDPLGTQYMLVSGSAVQFLALVSEGVACTRWPGKRCIAMTVANAICITGAAPLMGLLDNNKWSRLVAHWLCYFQGLGFSMSLTMVSSSMAGSTKEQLTAAIPFTGYCDVSAVTSS
ncbi:hypothetical protein DL766_007966 [Monosporascus sp. MC13-8B]|uniref:Major facilitator superfamily (MFS) profile domain-containing protein n=1 Tax=Monosporascus cannonballus TaxID=155416 RepID=A0ABY0HJS4_9PEZI|nr:hypothetical protein DL762_000438 [Monosporascus cannonballus]RYP01125.1 hypothetical protein DL763_000362 [Monosporascus cannonballus]RYP21316.1 hypothetical protein DL766_007966 [Monosporascus sp. MC13-8B]